MKKIDSKTSIGFPDIPDPDRHPKEKKKPVLEREELVTSVCQLLIYCERHDKICLSRVPSKSLWLPSIPMSLNDSWKVTVYTLLENIGVISESLSEEELINIFRIEMTQTSNFVTRLTFMIRILKGESYNKVDTKSNCCSNIDKYIWYAVKDVIESRSDHFWGPEIQLLTQFWIRNENIKNVSLRNEYNTRDALKDFCEQPTACTTNEQMMIRSACFVEKDILGLYDHFVQHCFPSQYMSFMSFRSVVKKMGLKINENNLSPTFRAFDCRQRSYLTFNEVVLGLAAMDQATEHGREPGQIRCTYIMRFYDSDSDGFLSQSDVCKMVEDIQKLSTSPHRESYNRNTSIKEISTQIIQTHGTNNKISLVEFTKAVGNLRLRGTSGLFRAQGATLRIVTKMGPGRSHLSSVALIKQHKYEGICQRCTKRSYKISKNVYKMSKNGEVLSFLELKLNSIKFYNEFNNKEVFDLSTEVINRLHEIKKRRFDDNRETNEIPIKLWFYPSKQILVQKLLKICEKSKQLFEKEERVLRVSAPCYVFGDIHGNLHDLMMFANDFWRMSPLLSECNYLFLGDYVDRGPFGVECVIYLFALKLIAPKSFWLVRGNHEVRSLQESFTFYNECVENYGEELWKSINEVFDRLPNSAVIDDKIFCSHGGIPATTNDIQRLRGVPTVLADPQNESSYVWEILWNDPMATDEFTQLTAFERKDLEGNHGFAENLKRGTAFYYSEQAVNNFMENNDIQYIIRGHEMIPNGYRFQMNGKVITVFSTSHYCNGNNEASVIFVNQNKIRVIRVQTSDNQF